MPWPWIKKALLLGAWFAAQTIACTVVGFLILTGACDVPPPDPGPPPQHPEFVQRLLDDCASAPDSDRYASAPDLCTAHDRGFEIFWTGDSLGTCWPADDEPPPTELLPTTVGTTNVEYVGACSAMWR